MQCRPPAVLPQGTLQSYRQAWVQSPTHSLSFPQLRELGKPLSLSVAQFPHL